MKPMNQSQSSQQAANKQSQEQQQQQSKQSAVYMQDEVMEDATFEDRHVIEEQAKLVKKIKKSDLHPFLKCSLCTGFYRDAHTINECLDTFCKSCIYKYFCEDTNRETCPKC